MSNSNVSVNIFNPGSTQINIAVNNGNVFAIAGASPSQGWQPQQPSSNPVSFNYGNPAPNTFGGHGPNQVMVRDDFGNQHVLQIHIPQSGPVISLQLYIFLSHSGVSWVMLNNGQTIGYGNA